MKQLTYLVFFFALLSCDKEYVPRAPGLKTPVCTGFNFNMGPNPSDYLGSIGNPNVKTSHGSYRMTAYPNPANSILLIKADQLSGFGTAKKSIWITHAVMDNNLDQSLNISNANAFVAGGTPIMQINSVTNGTIQFDLTEFSQGAYRVYVQFNDAILWDNILVTR